MKEYCAIDNCITPHKLPKIKKTGRRNSIGGKRKWVEDKIKVGRIGKVEDIMGAVVYLASDASSYVTGQDIYVDGGWSANGLSSK